MVKIVLVVSIVKKINILNIKKMSNRFVKKKVFNHTRRFALKIDFSQTSTLINPAAAKFNLVVA